MGKQARTACFKKEEPSCGSARKVQEVRREEFLVMCNHKFQHSSHWIRHKHETPLLSALISLVWITKTSWSTRADNVCGNKVPGKKITWTCTRKNVDNVLEEQSGHLVCVWWRGDIVTAVLLMKRIQITLSTHAHVYQHTHTHLQCW